MNKLNEKYIGMDLELALKDLQEKGYTVEVKKQLPKKDKEILIDEIVIKVEQKDEKTVNLITSMFKKYI